MDRGNTRVISNEYKYLEPNSIEEAIEMLDTHENLKIFSGGTDLLVALKKDEISPDYLMSIRKIERLNKIVKKDEKVFLGPKSTFSQIKKNEIINNHFNILVSAVNEVGGVQVKNMGTIGGNLCTASPLATTASPLLTLNAEMVLESIEGTRVIPLSEFFKGPRKTIMRSNELLTQIRIPLSDHNGFSYKEVKRVAEDLGKITVAVLLRREEDQINYCRIALGAVAPTPIRVKNKEKLLENEKYSEKLLEKVTSGIKEEIDPISDVRSTAEYREEVTGSIVKDCIDEAWRRSR